jgi:hypothetical protein
MDGGYYFYYDTKKKMLLYSNLQLCCVSADRDYIIVKQMIENNPVSFCFWINYYPS